MLLAEFAVLLEVSDHVFKPYPGIRRLGQLVTVIVCLGLLLIYIVPALWHPQSSSIAFLELEKRTALTKAVLIVALMIVARLYRVPFGRNISGMMLGFAAYLALITADTALAEALGRAVYGTIYNMVAPLSFVMALAIWTVVMWRYQAVVPGPSRYSRGGDNSPEPLGEQLGRYNNELSRRLRR
jgi:hypothetical protein